MNYGTHKINTCKLFFYIKIRMLILQIILLYVIFSKSSTFHPVQYNVVMPKFTYIIQNYFSSVFKTIVKF